LIRKTILFSIRESFQVRIKTAVEVAEVLEEEEAIEVEATLIIAEAEEATMVVAIEEATTITWANGHLTTETMTAASRDGMMVSLDSKDREITDFNDYLNLAL